jgi:hypothetical protein
MLYVNAVISAGDDEIDKIGVNLINTPALTYNVTVSLPFYSYKKTAESRGEKRHCFTHILTYDRKKFCNKSTVIMIVKLL